MIRRGKTRLARTIHHLLCPHFIVTSNDLDSMRRLSFLLLFLCLASAAHGQHTLTLSQCIELAQTSSPAAQIARLTFDRMYPLPNTIRWWRSVTNNAATADERG